MQKIFKPLFEDKITKLGFILSIIFMLVGFIFILIFFRNLPPYLPIYNKLSWGYARVGRKIEIFIPFVITLMIVLINNIIGAKVYEKIPLLSRILSATALGSSVLFFIFIIQLIYLIR